MRRRALALLASLCTSACSDELPPTGQVVLYVDSDAPFPPAPGTLAPDDSPPALFDSLFVEVFEPSENVPCEGCSRTFALDRQMLLERRASFGLPVRPGVEGYRVRLRLYHSASTLTATVPSEDAAGPPQSVIDVTALLPAVGEEGIVERTVVLRTEDVGMTLGTLDAPLESQPGPPSRSLVGSWPGAARTPCASSPALGEVCIFGGAYWMGHARVRGTGIGDANDRRRLVLISPFFLDQTEVTVAQYRAFDDGTSYALYPWSGSSSGSDWHDFCTFTPAPGPNEDRPIVCVSYEAARAYCQARGGDLPTEAQMEYAAGAMESRLFVWGSEEPACQDAVLRRYGYGIFGGLVNECTPPTPPGGVEAVGSTIDPPRRDRLELEGGTLYDVVGNATEWALDDWNRQQEPCWYQPGVLRDPRCATPSPADGSLRVFRTGSWVVGARQAAAAYRSPLIGSINLGQGIDLGFRCARPAGSP